MNALIVVDMQNDFKDPVGALYVPGAEEIEPAISDLLELKKYDIVVATQDYHPKNHVSFATTHEKDTFSTIDLYGHEQVMWPDHCVQGTHGVELWEPVRKRADVIVRKGMNPKVDSYSGFRNNWDRNGFRQPTGLEGYLRNRGVEKVYVCGLARDYCVKWTAIDAAEMGFETHFKWDYTRAVNPETDSDLHSELTNKRIWVD